MNRTKIEWVKNPPPPGIKVDKHGRWHDPTGKYSEQPGYTWNPITGCLNGCEYCYARKLANGRLRSTYLANQNIAPIGTMILGAALLNKALKNPFHPRFWPERIPEDVFVSIKRLEKISGKGIFVCDMSDLFGVGIPEEWQGKVFRVIYFNIWHRFYLLTKQPQNLIKWSPFPDNCWVGVTVCADGDATNAYYGLSHIEAGKRFVSFEPLLGAITMKSHRLLDVVDWVIIGAQTKPYKSPRIEWVQEIVEAADKSGIPVFLKDNLSPLLVDNEKYSWAYKPRGIYNYPALMQEMPIKKHPENQGVVYLQSRV